jgi:O-methyltransferase
MKIVRTVMKGFAIGKTSDEKAAEFPPDFTMQDAEMIKRVKSYTMTSPERIFALIQSVKYILDANILGTIVECGTWRGGSMMAVAHTLLRHGILDRDLYLFDTFEGMTKPTQLDISYLDESALVEFARRKWTDNSSDWCCASLEEVRQNLINTGYPNERFKFVKGKVEDNLPSFAPEKIALLRLDTDWYESTRHELIHLYPRLALGGVLIIDDYGYWKGAKKATDEYLSQNNINLLLHRIDAFGRIALKPWR